MPLSLTPGGKLCRFLHNYGPVALSWLCPYHQLTFTPQGFSPLPTIYYGLFVGLFVCFLTGHQKLYHNNEPPGSLSSTFLWTALGSVDNLLRKLSSTLPRTCPHPHGWLSVSPFPLFCGHFKFIYWEDMAFPLLYGNKVHFYSTSAVLVGTAR